MEISILDLLKSLKRHLTIIVICVCLLGLILALYGFISFKPQYSVKADFSLSVARDYFSPKWSQPSTITLLKQAASSSEDLLNSKVFLSSLNLNASSRNGNLSPAYIRFTNTSDNRFGLLNLTITTDNAQKALEIQEKIINSAAAFVKKYEKGVTLSLLEKSSTVEKLGSAGVKKKFIKGSFLGLILGIAYAFLKDLFIGRIYSQDELSKALNVQILGNIPALPLSKK